MENDEYDDIILYEINFNSIDNLESAKIELFQLNNEYITILEKYKQNKITHQNEISVLKKTITNLENQLHEYNKDLKTISINSSIDDTINLYTSQLDNLFSDSININTLLSNIEDESLNTLRRKNSVDDYQKLCEDYQDEIIKLNSKIQNLKYKNTNLKVTNQNYNTNILLIKSEKEKLDINLKYKDEEINKLNQTLSNLKTKYEEIFSDFEQNNSSLNSQIKNLQQELNTLKLKYKNILDDKNFLEDKLKTSQIQIEKYRNSPKHIDSPHIKKMAKFLDKKLDYINDTVDKLTNDIATVKSAESPTMKNHKLNYQTFFTIQIIDKQTNNKLSINYINTIDLISNEDIEQKYKLLFLLYKNLFDENEKNRNKIIKLNTYLQASLQAFGNLRNIIQMNNINIPDSLNINKNKILLLQQNTNDYNKKVSGYIDAIINNIIKVINYYCLKKKQ